MYNNHPDYLFHLVRTVVDRALPEVMLTHKNPMGDVLQEHKTVSEVWKEGDEFTLGLAYRPFHLLWQVPEAPLRLPTGVDYDSVMVNGVAVPLNQFDLGHNLLLPTLSVGSPLTGYPHDDQGNLTLKQNWPVRDPHQPSRRPGGEKVVVGMVDETFRGIAYNSDDFPIQVYAEPSGFTRALGTFSKSGMQVSVQPSRNGTNRLVLKAQEGWPRPLYVRYKIVPQKAIVFRIAQRQPSFGDTAAERRRIKPSLMGTTDDKEFNVYAQWFQNTIDFDCFAIEPVEAMRLAEQFRLAMLHYAGYLKEMGVSDLIFQGIMAMDDNFMRPNRDAKLTEAYWTRYRVTFHMRTEEVHLVPTKPLYDLNVNTFVQSDS